MRETKKIDLFMVQMQKVRKQFVKTIDSTLQPFGISGKNSSYIMALHMKGKDGLTLSQLTNMAEVHRASTTRAIAELVEKGICSTDQHDNSKKYKVFLTEYGKEVASKLVSTAEEGKAKLDDNLTSEEFDQLIFLVKKLAGGMND